VRGSGDDRLESPSARLDGRRMIDRRYLGAAALLAAGIAGWDLATRGSALVAIVMAVTAAALGLSAVLSTSSERKTRTGSISSGLLSAVASRTGFSSNQSLVVRSVLGVMGVTLIQRFALYPSAAVGFDLGVSIAALAIMLLLANFMVGSPRAH
jgi:hypothetical protein